MKKCLVIYNPQSGKKELSKYWPEIKKLIESKKYEVISIATEHKGHATELIETAPDVDLVMSFGGDGTFNEVMTGNLRRKEPLLLTHIPVGTTNDIGAMLGYTKDIIRNVKLSLNGVDKEFDIGLINGRPFIYVVGFGKFTNISYETPRDLKRKIGQLAYIKEALIAFFGPTKLYKMSYEIDGKEYSGEFSLVLISNANHIAGIKNIYKDVKLDDGQLEVVFCTIKKRKDIFRALEFLASDTPNQVPGFSFYRTGNIKLQIHDEEYKSGCIDGEKLKNPADGTFDIGIVPKVKIKIPKRYPRKLFNKNT